MKIIISYKTKSGWKGAVNNYKAENYNQIAHLIWEELKRMNLKDFIKKRIIQRKNFNDWVRGQESFQFFKVKYPRIMFEFELASKHLIILFLNDEKLGSSWYSIQEISLLKKEPKWRIDKRRNMVMKQFK